MVENREYSKILCEVYTSAFLLHLLVLRYIINKLNNLLIREYDNDT